MEKTIVRTFCYDGDICEVVFRYDHQSGKHFGDYPDFEETPRHTKNGWKWITATQEGCALGVNKYAKDDRCMDCGSCEHFIQEKAGDLIGICGNAKNRKGMTK